MLLQGCGSGGSENEVAVHVTINHMVQFFEGGFQIKCVVSIMVEIEYG